MIPFRLFALLIFAIWLTCGPAQADRRVALVIGNSAYKSAPKLGNPVNDATLVGGMFKKAGFDSVDVRLDLSASEMRRMLREFAGRTRDADVAVIYYAGHGIELDGTNYLIPTDATLETDGDVLDETIPVERALFAMVANRACAPCSKLYCWEQWLKEEVHIPGTHGLSLQHLYRAMDFLEANKEPLEREIFHRVADLLNLDVEVLFYDTTSLHFEIDLDDEGIGPDDLVHGSSAAGAKAYRAPRKRGLSKNGRGDAPQIVVGMAVTREGFPVRHWVFPGNTVDVTTVAQVKRDLRDWQLTRCLFVGDAGMVSAANFKALAAGGGKYLMCMPLRRGDALTERKRSANHRLAPSMTAC